MNQDQVNQEEWENPDNWTSSGLMSVYFSKKDTRSLVPKQKRWMGWTFNLGRTAGVVRFTVTILAVCLFITIVNVVTFLAVHPEVPAKGKDSQPPRVVSTYPQNGAREVDPALKEISVTFNEEMRNLSWSWAYEDKSTFPQIIGQPFFTENYTRNILPVQLERNREYTIWINTNKYQNFKDKSGNPALPFKFTFTTAE